MALSAAIVNTGSARFLTWDYHEMFKKQCPKSDVAIFCPNSSIVFLFLSSRISYVAESIISVRKK